MFFHTKKTRFSNEVKSIEIYKRTCKVCGFLHTFRKISVERITVNGCLFCNQ